MKPRKPIDQRRVFGVVVALCVLLFILGYAFYTALPLLLGPSLSISEEQTASSTSHVFGTTKRVSFLEINGAAVPLEENGNFSITRAYPSGYTELEAVAKDRFGRSITKKLTFVSSSTTTYGTKKESRESTSTDPVIR